MTPEQKILDRYYHKKFGWALAEVDALFESQGNVCKICGRPPGKYRLRLDHDHAYDRVKIRVLKDCDNKNQWVGWVASDEFIGTTLLLPGGNWYGKTREIVKSLVTTALRRRSVRGGLCLRCNKGIQMFEDSKAPLSPEERFDNAAKYFREFKFKN